jgi:hypothetical protein
MILPFVVAASVGLAIGMLASTLQLGLPMNWWALATIIIGTAWLFFEGQYRERGR